MINFFGRKKEFEEYKQEKTKKDGSLYVKKGRRRIGKSEFIKEFGRQNKFQTVCIQGLGVTDQKKTMKTQIENFCELAQIELKDPSFKYDNWNQVFFELSERIKNMKEKRILLLLDEISWMARDNDGLLESFKTAWDNYFQYQNVCIFLCGSVSAWIEKNIVRDTAFLGRITKTVTLEEMIIEDAKLFWSDPSTNPKIKLKTLFFTGGVAKYLDEIDPNLTAEQSIQNLCFSPNGFLFKEFDNFFEDSFDRKSTVYKKILLLLVEGKKNQAELIRATGYTNGIEPLLEELKQAGFIKEEKNFKFDSDKEKKDRFFSIKDNYSLFYLKYIEPHKEKIEKGIYSNSKALEQFPQWKSISGLLFENIVKKNIHLILNDLQLSLASINNYDSYSGRKSKDVPQGFQIDLLIEDIHGQLFLCELKMKKSIGIGVETEVKKKISRLEKKLRKKVHPIKVLIYSGELSSELEKSSYFNKKINFDTFFE